TLSHDWSADLCSSALSKTITITGFFFSSRRRHTRFSRDWSSDVCSSDLGRFINQSMIFWSVLLSTLLVCVSRWIFVKIVDVGQLKRRVVIYGAGARAAKLLADLAPEVDVLGVKVVGCIPSGREEVKVAPSLVIPEPADWLAFTKQFQISEIVISPDERRRSEGDVFPLSQFLDCKLAGIPSSDALSFCEREL